MRNVLNGIVKDIHSAFNTSELAYLSLTAKSENHIRDKIAFQLNTRYPKKLIAREWKKVDIAVFKKRMIDYPEALIEMKLTYTSSIVRKRDGKARYLKDLLHDINDAKSIAVPETSVYGILFLIHVKNEIQDEVNRTIIKNFNPINAQLRKYRTEKELSMDAKNKVISYFGDTGLQIKSGKMELGKSLGIDVDLDYFIIGPDYNPN